MTNLQSRILNHPRLRKYTALIHEDLSATYSRDLHKWLIVAPIVGYYLSHPLAIVPGLLVGFIITGLIMQYATPDPDEHSTEEIIRSYHEHQGHIQMRPFVPKLLAAITTVGFGGSAALE